MRLLLDTDAYSAFKRGHAAVNALISKARHVHFSVVVAGELLAGSRAGSRLRKNLEDLEEFLASPYVSLEPVTLAAADRYSRVAAALRKKGMPIPTNDLWIAAQAMESGANLVSFDAHFARIEGLAWVHPDFR